MQVIECEMLVDGVSDEPIANGRVLGEDGRAVAAGAVDEVDVPDGATIQDHSDATVIPGLIDAHLHLFGSRSRKPVRLAEGFDRTGHGARDGGSASLAGCRVHQRPRRLKHDGTGPPGRRRRGNDSGSARVHERPEYLADGRTRRRSLSPLRVGRERGRWCGPRRRCGRVPNGGAKAHPRGRRPHQNHDDGGVLSEKDAPDQSQFTDAEIQAFTEEAHGTRRRRRLAIRNALPGTVPVQIHSPGQVRARTTNARTNETLSPPTRRTGPDGNP